MKSILYDTTWVFAAGMRRSASTLQYLLAKDLIEHVGGRAAGWVTHQKFTEVYQELDGYFPFVLLKTHAFTPAFASIANILFQKDRAKALTIFRDPRDVAASLMNRNEFTQTWQNVLINLPTVLKEFTAWSSLPEEQCLVQNYEQSMQSMLQEIGDFLDILCSSRLEKKCLKRHTLDAHRKLMAKLDEGGYDKKNLLWYNHIDEGKTGRYKEELTVEQLAEVDRIVEDWKRKL